MAKVAREIDRITALEVTMSPQRVNLATPPMANRQILSAIERKFYESRDGQNHDSRGPELIDRITSHCTVTSGVKLMIVARAELGDVKPSAMKVVNAQKSLMKTTICL